MLACGLGAVCCSLPMFGFPKQFPGVAEVKSKKVSESVTKDVIQDDISLWDGIKSLGRNPVFMFASFGSAMDGYLSQGSTLCRRYFLKLSIIHLNFLVMKLKIIKFFFDDSP